MPTWIQPQSGDHEAGAAAVDRTDAFQEVDIVTMLLPGIRRAVI